MPQNDPLFLQIFGDTWNNLPPAMKQRYGVRQGLGDRVRMTGYLNISMCKAYKLITPLMRLTGTLIPICGNFPTVVDFETNIKNSKSHLIRRVDTGSKTIIFDSHWLKRNNEIVEVMASGFCWRAHYSWDGVHINIEHVGYAFKLGKRFINLPLTWLFGRGDAQETPLSDDQFSMWMTIKHPLWGELYHYEGAFTLEKSS